MAMTTEQTTRTHRDTQIDVKVVLSGLWITMLMVFAYVDIFGFFRADVLEAALDGEIASTSFSVNQVFLTSTLIYILIPSLMIISSLLLKPRLNRVLNISVASLYAVSIVVSCIGEQWVYYLLGSAVEVLLLLTIARTAWAWPKASASTVRGRAHRNP